MTDLQYWRVPDVSVGSDHTRWAVWYGPGGEDGDCATEIEQDGLFGFTVTEYQDATGLIDDLDAARPILSRSSYVDASETTDYLLAVGIGVDRIAYERRHCLSMATLAL